jgi:hypothetical protein
MFTKTQIKIMEIFVSKINKKFSIKEISEELKKPYALIYKSVQDLIKKGFLLKDDKNLIFLNYKDNLPELSYIESERKIEFLDKHKTIELFCNDAIKEINEDFFILLIFGSVVEKKDFKDIDILLIAEENKVREIEKFLENLSSNFTEKFDINVIPIKGVYEMISKRDDINLANETLNKHIIVFGAENYYNILKNGR